MEENEPRILTGYSKNMECDAMFKTLNKYH